MKTLFPGHYRPSDEDFAELWSTCIFSFDANVLLGVYRYTNKTRDAFLKVLEDHKDRVWLTHRAAQEFQRNRVEVILRETAAFSGHQDAIDKILSEASHHAYLTQDDQREIDKAKEGIKSVMDVAKARQPDLLKQDELRDRLDLIFAGRVGSPGSAEEQRALFAEADARTAQKLPPGYMDAGKSDAALRRGDAVLWLQLLAKSREMKRPVVFITDEQKEDWWQRHKGRTIGPRFELVEEFLERCDQRFYMYDIGQFLEYAEIHLKAAGVSEAVAEVRQREATEDSEEHDAFLKRSAELARAHMQRSHGRNHEYAWAGDLLSPGVLALAGSIAALKEAPVGSARLRRQRALKTARSIEPPALHLWLMTAEQAGMVRRSERGWVLTSDGRVLLKDALTFTSPKS